MARVFPRLGLGTVILFLGACSLGSAVSLNQSYDLTFTGVSTTLTVPSTASTVSLSGTASVDGTNNLFVSVIDPSGNTHITTIKGDGSGVATSQKVSGSWPAQAGTWTLRVTAPGAQGNFSVTLQF